MPFVSVFNDVLGPVMRGPSSSHTAGAYRIGLLAARILDAPPRRVRCTFDPEGSFAATYLPLGVEPAFAAALLGWEMTDPRYESAVEALEASGIELGFSVEPLEIADHPNEVRVDLEGRDGRRRRLWARSVGGGCVEIHRVDDTDLMLTGKERDLLVFLSRPARAADSEVIGRALGLPEPVAAAGKVLHFVPPPGWKALPGDIAPGLGGIERVVAVEPVFHLRKGEALFTSAAEALALAEAGGMSLGEVTRRYEAQFLGETPAWVDREILARYRIMTRSVEAGLDDANVAMTLRAPSASSIMRKDREGLLPTGGKLTRAAARAMAALHTCNSRGVVCAAPTGGSSGVIPGVIRTLEEEHHLSETDLLRALWAASAVGLVFALRATFAAEVAGCQVEIGAAGAMAAAAVVESAGGSPAAALDAASIALQNTMGSVCDPVQGGCEIPCHTRNAAAAANAFLCADLVLGGYANPIPLDEAVDASLAVGRSLPRELRCTALGGIASAPSARSLQPRSLRS
jgi:L-serine dehydratase